MESPDIFTEEVIIDELVDFVIAGTLTSSLTSEGILGHYATDK